MKYAGMPFGMWTLFAPSFRNQLTAVFGYGTNTAKAITKKAKPKYREIISELPEFEKGDRFKMNLVNCAMIGAFILSMPERPDVERLTEYYAKSMMTKPMKWFCRKSGKNKFTPKDISGMKATATLKAADRNPYSWNMEFYEYPDGSGYEGRFTKCGICTLMQELGLYDLTGGQQQGGELAALGAALDGVDDRLALAEREGLLATAEGTGLERREALFRRKPAAVTPEERREAIAALLRISEDSLTPEAINDTLTGCGIRAKAEETAEGLRVIFPKTAGIPADFEQIQSIILDILPCHLEVEFYFRYLTWAECEAAGMTWASVEAAGHTWASFELAVPPEA